jgi:hypothetical protein
MSQNLVAWEGFLLLCIYPLPCLYSIIQYRVSWAFSDRFSLNYEKEKENQEYAIFLKFFTFFSILISEF